MCSDSCSKITYITTVPTIVLAFLKQCITKDFSLYEAGKGNRGQGSVLPVKENFRINPFFQLFQNDFYWGNCDRAG